MGHLNTRQVEFLDPHCGAKTLERPHSESRPAYQPSKQQFYFESRYLKARGEQAKLIQLVAHQPADQ